MPFELYLRRVKKYEIYENKRYLAIKIMWD